MDTKKLQIIEKVKKHKGIIYLACEEIELPRSTFYLWYNNDNEFKSEIDSIREIIVDLAEKKLMDLVEEGDTTATIFTLKTLGKKRGYIEKQEIINTNLNVEVQEVTEEMQNELLNTLKRMIE